MHRATPSAATAQGWMHGSASWSAPTPRRRRGPKRYLAAVSEALHANWQLISYVPGTGDRSGVPPLRSPCFALTLRERYTKRREQTDGTDDR